MRYLFLLLLLAWSAFAQDTEELNKNQPVCIISLVSGPCEVKTPDSDWQAAYWLTMLRPEDQLRTPPNGKLVLDFFADDHLEIVDPGTEAKIAFRNVVKTSPSGNVRLDPARDRARTEIAIPYLLMRKLFAKDFEGADEPDAMAKENQFLTARVKAEAFPPVFFWKNTGAPHYRFQLFNEWDQFLYEKKVVAKGPEVRFKFPYDAPFQLAKSSEYAWQVLAPDDTIVVRKYKFTILTQPLADQVERAEKNFEKLKKSGKANQTTWCDLFLLYQNRKLIDKYLHILQDMARQDPENPVIQRALVRAYLSKGCPAHAREAREKELQLGGIDPLEK